MAVSRFNPDYPDAGLVQIVPTSVAVGSGSGSVNGNGSASFTGASSVSLNDIFSDVYENYLFIGNIEASASANITVRLRVSGADASGADYENQNFESTSTTNTGQRQTGTVNFLIGANQNNNRNAFQLTVYEPFLTRATSFQSHYFRGEPTIRISYGAHLLTTSYTGLSFIADSGTVTGKISVYGYRS